MNEARPVVWIFSDDKGCVFAENNNGKVIARNGNLTQLEGSLDLIYNYRWKGNVSLG